MNMRMKGSIEPGGAGGGRRWGPWRRSFCLRGVGVCHLRTGLFTPEVPQTQSLKVFMEAH